MRETMVTGVWDNQQPDDLEAGEGVYVTTKAESSTIRYFFFALLAVPLRN